MENPGVTTDNLTLTPVSDEVMVNRSNTTYRQRTSDLATQLAAAGPIADLLAAVGDGVKAYDTRALLYADLVPVDKVVAWVVLDPTPALNGKYRKAGASGLGTWTRFGDLDNSSIANELIAARGASASLATRLTVVRGEAAGDAVNFLWQYAATEPLKADSDRASELGAKADINGRYIERIDEYGRTLIKRPSDPDNAADGQWGPSWLDYANQYLLSFGEPGHLIEPGQAWGGVVGKEVDGRPYVIDQFGTKNVLSASASIGDVTMGGPYLVKAAFAEPSIGQYTIRLFGPSSTGGSIFAGPLIQYDEIDGQSLSVGSAATELFYQMLHSWRGCVFMVDRAEGSIVDDVRAGNHALDTQAPSLIEVNVTGFLPLEEKLSGSGYGGQTIASSFADKINERIEADVGRPQLRLCAAVGAGGASYAELGPGTLWWTNKLNVMRAANRIARARGARLFKPVKKILHGESDHLRYSAAEQLAGTGYYADILDWHAADNTETKSILGQQADVLFLFLAESQRHPGLQITSPVAMLDAMRNHPDKVIVAGPQYQIHAQGHGQADAVHLKASGEVIAGEYLARAEYELINRRNRAWRPLHMTGIAWDGASGIQVTIHNPENTALVVDTASIALRPGWGFTVAVDGVETPVTNVTINSTTQLTLQLGGVPSAGTFRGLHYACKGPPTVPEADPLTNTPAGNIRNTRTELSRIPGFVLHDWLNTDHIAF
ncbi:hypothetical protein [Rhizobium herbae]